MDGVQAVHGWEITATNTESLLRARVLPEFDAKKLKKITGRRRREMDGEDDGGGASPSSTVYTHRRILAQILDQAVDDGLIVSDPAKEAKAPAVRRRCQLFLSADELRELADECGEFAPLL